MAVVQEPSLYRNRNGHSGIPCCALPAVAAGHAGRCELCLLYDNYNGREEESKAGHDDDPKDDMLYMDDSIFPVVCENKKTDR